ncbi:PIN domain-containing protein [Pedobacter cryotolerans]|uniref:PIN domain-containing protein n=1 Tax=Pedobacter cryotolerans TaxID=2571270 RepID=A0A4V5NY76_9SPHI|nr:PIN domain-containing protein [Pedobacter cryotolerans]TKC01413.1 PIN domain-containing protein [Pedobacter cryotolerans]
MNIINLNINSSPQDCYYILDSNVWLPILGLDDEPTSSHYQIFFDKLLKKENPQILLCSVQLSEILNRLLRFDARKVYDRKYDGKTGSIPKFTTFYKDEYRCSEDFKLKYESIIDDISGFSYGFQMVEPSKFDFDALTNFEADKMDFNDHYFCLLAKEYGATIVTHDADFFGLDVNVATFNLRLYKAYTNSIKPKLI